MMTVPSQLEGVRLGSNVTLRCKSEAFPASINYWVRGQVRTVLSLVSSPHTSYWSEGGDRDLGPEAEVIQRGAGPRDPHEAGDHQVRDQNIKCLDHHQHLTD